MSFIDTLKRLSSGSNDSGGSTSSPRANVWSSTFSPGVNANMKKVGSSYYDKPAANDNKKTMWDQHLESEKSRPISQSSSMKQQQDAVDVSSLRSMFTADRVESALKKADPSGSGKVDFSQFMSLLRKDA